ncbi:hypothetical protein THAOC_15178, partial [Thalassiosira oceanica]
GILWIRTKLATVTFPVRRGFLSIVQTPSTFHKGYGWRVRAEESRKFSVYSTRQRPNPWVYSSLALRVMFTTDASELSLPAMTADLPVLVGAVSASAFRSSSSASAPTKSYNKGGAAKWKTSGADRQPGGITKHRPRQRH